MSCWSRNQRFKQPARSPARQHASSGVRIETAIPRAARAATAYATPLRSNAPSGKLLHGFETSLADCLCRPHPSRHGQGDAACGHVVEAHRSPIDWRSNYLPGSYLGAPRRWLDDEPAPLRLFSCASVFALTAGTGGTPFLGLWKSETWRPCERILLPIPSPSSYETIAGDSQSCRWQRSRSTALWL